METLLTTNSTTTATANKELAVEQCRRAVAHLGELMLNPSTSPRLASKVSRLRKILIEYADDTDRELNAEQAAIELANAAADAAENEN